MERTLQVLKDFESEGIIGRYAIGGAIGATFYAEHLIALCLKTGRMKDRQRVPMLLTSENLDTAFLNEILERHDLEGRFRQWTL